MSREWTCEECVKKDTDACYFQNAIDGYKYCNAVLVDNERAYQLGRADAIDEFAREITHWKPQTEEYMNFNMFVSLLAEQLKEQKND